MSKASSTISKQVADFLRNEIINGNFNPGERIKESMLTSRFEVSSIPVREALKRIESEGFIEIVPYAGAVVKKVDLKLLDENVDISLMLMEYIFTSPAFEKISSKEIDEGEKIIDAMENCDDISQFPGLVTEFFDHFYKVAEKPAATEIALCILRRNMVLLSVLLRNIYHGKFDVTKHRMFIRCLREKDFATALSIRKELLINQTNSIKLFYTREQQ